MSKNELRAACKAAGITGYGKMNNDQMRAALEAHAAPVPAAAAQAESTEPPAATTPPVAETTPAPSAAPAAAEKPAKPARVQAEERNGVRAPIKGVCRDVWNALDEMLKTGTAPIAKNARELSVQKGWNANNTLIELARWKKFSGLAKQRNSR